ncbi:MAG TPA: transposase [Kineosporiaceae bacterium]|nr:transposase [Kineosporiaceae bacterium]
MSVSSRAARLKASAPGTTPRSSHPERPSARPACEAFDVSSRRLRAEYVGRINRASTRGHLWSPPYLAASCGAAPLGIVKEYIRGQKRPHQGRHSTRP